MLYLLFKRKSMAELDAGSDLQARQFAMANREIDRVETETGRVVYRRIKEGVDKWADSKGAKP